MFVCVCEREREREREREMGIGGGGLLSDANKLYSDLKKDAWS